jgi:hypothetical protein
MTRLRALLVTVVLAASLPPATATAVPLSVAQGALGDQLLPRGALASGLPPTSGAQLRLLTVEIMLLPSGRLAARPAVALSRLPAPPDRHAQAPVILPLPGAMPLFLAALAGLVLVSRRRRPAAPLAEPSAAS